MCWKKSRQPVECLGMTFPNDEERRKHFLGQLREKLKDPEFRKIEGFPIGSDEDILALSDPPYYTACPNPFIADFIKHYGKPYDPSKPYSREPFAVDVSEGKTDPIYKAHSYHTKVPHLAIVPSILHYTEPGDVVLDGFCGSGMTGVAAQWCGSAPEDYRRKVEAEFEKQGMPKPEVGRAARGAQRPVARGHLHRRQLQPAVRCPTNSPRRAGESSMRSSRKSGWMYETSRTRDGKTKGRIEVHRLERGLHLPRLRGRSGLPRRSAGRGDQARQGYLPVSALRGESDQGQLAAASSRRGLIPRTASRGNESSTGRR